MFFAKVAHRGNFLVVKSTTKHKNSPLLLKVLPLTVILQVSYIYALSLHPGVANEADLSL